MHTLLLIILNILKSITIILLQVVSGEDALRNLFLDVRIFNPHAPSNRNGQLSAYNRRHEQVKKRVCEQRVREIEHASFTPLVLAIEATHFYKRLASCLASKWCRSYSSVMSWLHCRLTFSLLRSVIQCIRDARPALVATLPLTLLHPCSESRFGTSL